MYVDLRASRPGPADRAHPDFSVALNRGSIKAEQNSTLDPHLGYIAFGGLPPVKTTGKSVTVPVQTYSVASSTKPQYFFYTVRAICAGQAGAGWLTSALQVDVDAYVFPGSQKLHTNSSAMYVSRSHARAYVDARSRQP
jgi:hypothetical protein